MPKQNDQKKTGGNIWLYISIGLIIIIMLPEIDSNNDTPIFLAIQKIPHQNGYTYKIKATTSNVKRLNFYTSEFDHSIYKDYIEYIIQVKTEHQFVSKLNSLLEEVRKVSTNVEFITIKNFKEKFYVHE